MGDQASTMRVGVAGDPGTFPRGQQINRLPRRVKHAAVIECRRRCWELRLAGCTQAEIARTLGVSEPTVKRHLAHALGQYTEQCAKSADEWRSQELARLDGLARSLWPNRADPRVADTLMRISELRGKLIPGMAAPSRMEHSGPGGRAIPIAAVTFDATKLTSEKLRTLESLLAEGMVAAPNGALPEPNGANVSVPEGGTGEGVE